MKLEHRRKWLVGRNHRNPSSGGTVSSRCVFDIRKHWVSVSNQPKEARHPPFNKLTHLLLITELAAQME